MPSTRTVVGFRQAPVRLDVDSGRVAQEEQGAKSTLRPHAPKQAMRLHHKTGENPAVSRRDTGRRWERGQTEVSDVVRTVPVIETKGTGERDGESPTSSPHTENFAERPLKLEGLTSVSKATETWELMEGDKHFEQKMSLFHSLTVKLRTR